MPIINPLALTRSASIMALQVARTSGKNPTSRQIVRLLSSGPAPNRNFSKGLWEKFRKAIGYGGAIGGSIFLGREISISYKAGQGHRFDNIKAEIKDAANRTGLDKDGPHHYEKETVLFTAKEIKDIGQDPKEIEHAAYKEVKNLPTSGWLMPSGKNLPATKEGTMIDLRGENPITTTSNRGSHSVLNQTRSGHIFKGEVNTTVFLNSNGDLCIKSVGKYEGKDGSMPKLNNRAGPLIFADQQAQIRERLRSAHQMGSGPPSSAAGDQFS